MRRKFPRPKVVCAFNTVPSEVLFDVFEAKDKATRPSLVYCGDDQSAKNTAAKLIQDVGFDPVDCGLFASRATLSRSHCSSANSPMRAEAARNWHTDSSGFRNERRNDRNREVGRLLRHRRISRRRADRIAVRAWRKPAQHSEVRPSFTSVQLYSCRRFCTLPGKPSPSPQLFGAS